MMKLTIHLLIIIALTYSLSEAACIEQTDTASIDQTKPNQNDSLSTSVSNFFMDVGCSIQNGAKTVKERVQSGYQFLKHKITDNDSATETTIIDNYNVQLYDLNGYPKIPLAPEEYRSQNSIPKGPLDREDDRIIFDGPYETSTLQTQSIIQTTPAVFSLDDRISLTAPTICKNMERLQNGTCRKVNEF